MENIKKAKKIKTLEIPEDKIKLVDLEEFDGLQGEIFKFENKLLAKKENQWIMAEIENFENTKEEIYTTNKNLEKEIIEIKKWCKNLKNYIDLKFEGIQKIQEQIIKNQAEILKTTKDYIDNKINALNLKSPKDKK